MEFSLRQTADEFSSLHLPQIWMKAYASHLNSSTEWFSELLFSSIKEEVKETQEFNSEENSGRVRTLAGCLDTFTAV